MRNIVFHCIVVLLVGICFPLTVHSQWSGSDTINTPLCTASYEQNDPAACSDGEGGAIVTWWDERSDAGNIYVQRVDKDGVVRWTPDGVPVCVMQNIQWYPLIISDGAGGAIMIWQDQRTAMYSGDIYAQRVSGDGTLLWGENGKGVKIGAAFSPVMTTDGAGGAIIAWRDDRINTDAADVYAQRIDSSGTVLWPASGVAITTLASQQWPAGIVSDDSGGAIITITHVRPDGSQDLYARRITGSGQALWQNNGIAITNLATWEKYPRTMADGSGGAYIVWLDDRSQTGYDQIFAQRITRSGSMLWPMNGKPLTVLSQYITLDFEIVNDGGGGGFLAYQVGIGYDYHIHGQRFNPAGNVLWDTSGVPLCSAARHRYRPRMINDGRGAAIMTWYDGRKFDSTSHTEEYDIYAQRIDTSGIVSWLADGVPVSSALRNQIAPAIVPTPSGGAIIVWTDDRSGSGWITAYDIYAERLNANGTVTGIRPDNHPVEEYALDQNFPNPFNPETRISFVIGPGDVTAGSRGGLSSFVSLKVYDVLGREVATLVNGITGSGEYSHVWNAGSLSSGTYYYRLYAFPAEGKGSAFTSVKKMLLIR